MLNFTLNSGVQILSALAAIFFAVYLYVMHLWSSLSPEDPKSFKVAFFTTLIHTFQYFVWGVIIISVMAGFAYLIKFIDIKSLFIEL